ncbi:MAG TPA: hypothetical protein VKA63_12045 [Candidatus Krumholzibacteria bacterium]|nr:hypothetical protein [Candidatus Krumholzibacteria bacterium]
MTRATSAAIRDYPRRVRFPLSLLLSVVLLAIAAEGHLKGREWAGEAGLLITSMLLMLWTGLVSGHLKQVLARPEGSLAPHYKTVQLRMALIVVSPPLVFAIVGALLAGLSLVASLALVLLVFSIYWSWPFFIEHGNLLMLFGPSLFFMVSTLTELPRQDNWNAWLEISERATVYWLLAILFSLALLAFTIHRMLRLSESSFEYRFDPSICWRSGSSPDSDTPFIALFQNLLPWFGRYSLRPRLSVYRAGALARVAHWRRGMGPRSPMVSGLSMALLMALMGMFFLIYQERHSHAETGLVFVYLVMLPLSRFGHTQRRRTYMEREALFPVARERLARELGFASSFDIFSSWFFLCLGTVALRMLGLFPTVSWNSIPYLVFLSLGTTLLGIGFSPWFLRFNGDKLPALILSMLVLIAGGSVGLALRSSVGFGGWGAWLSMVLLLCGLGVLTAYLGYRSWAKLELGRRDLW